MPLFEYRCPTCDHDFELLVRGRDVPTCPDCGTRDVEKLLSVAAAPSSSGRMSLPVAGRCPPADAPPCSPGCCRLP
ncbi:MAG: zinc ribbon domain-containing protein [Planctomycetales bacterium]|nr:zinc ribbon domain-containing protein [Planctomycetales bacterium]